MSATLQLFAPEREEPLAAAEPREEWPTWSERHRRECEARFLTHLAREERQRYYEGVKRVRGETALHELVAEVKRQWQIANAL